MPKAFEVRTRFGGKDYDCAKIEGSKFPWIKIIIPYLGRGRGNSVFRRKLYCY